MFLNVALDSAGTLFGQIATRSGDLERAILTLTSVVSASREKRTAGS
jgi:hypothetical protein